MIATLWSPSRRPSAPYPRLEVSLYIPRAAFHRISVTVTLHNPSGVGRTLDVGATLSWWCGQDGCKRRDRLDAAKDIADLDEVAVAGRNQYRYT